VSANILIFGASGTLGGAIARELLERQCSLGLHYCAHRYACEKLFDESASPRISFFQADVTDAAALQNLGAECLKRFERLDGMVWACGIAKDAPLVSLADDDLRAVVNTNLKGFFLALKVFSRQFIKQKSGSILALSSHAALAGRAGGSAYAMAHSGLLALVKSAAREWGGIGVRVNALIPPFVAESRLGQSASPAFVENAKARSVLRTAKADASVFASFAAGILLNPSISGQVLSADSRIAG
jgi:3-oxoacyl-[acyl-carrier protein] reductase